MSGFFFSRWVCLYAFDTNWKYTYYGTSANNCGFNHFKRKITEVTSEFFRERIYVDFVPVHLLMWVCARFECVCVFRVVNDFQYKWKRKKRKKGSASRSSRNSGDTALVKRRKTECNTSAYWSLIRNQFRWRWTVASSTINTKCHWLPNYCTRCRTTISHFIEPTTLFDQPMKFISRWVPFTVTIFKTISVPLRMQILTRTTAATTMSRNGERWE